MNLYNRLQRIGRGEVNLSAHDAWVLLSAAQLAWRHPQLGEPLKAHLWDVGHRLAGIFAEDQLVSDLAAMGWIETLDVPRKDS